jgi:hypothetical protein
MVLPGSEHAVIDAAKLRDYLLSYEHPVGRFKAAFFAAPSTTSPVVVVESTRRVRRSRNKRREY